MILGLFILVSQFDPFVVVVWTVGILGPWTAVGLLLWRLA